MSSGTLVLDSSVWIEILNRGPLVKTCTQLLKNAEKVCVPTLVLFEVYKEVTSSRSEDQGLSAIGLLSQHEVVDMTREIALAAADLSLHHELAMADSIVLAHAQQVGGVLITLDNDFAGISGAQVLHRS